MTDLDRLTEALVGRPASPEQARARRQQQASQDRFDHAFGLVDQAADAIATGDHVRLGRLAAKLDGLAFDRFEQRHPGHAAVDFALYDVVCDLVDDDPDATFGQT